MNAEELVALVLLYDEWVDDLDETACSTGFVSCPICDGGGYRGRWNDLSEKRPKPKSNPPTHRPDCPRLKFNQEYQGG